MLPLGARRLACWPSARQTDVHEVAPWIGSSRPVSRPNLSIVAVYEPEASLQVGDVKLYVYVVVADESPATVTWVGRLSRS